MSQNPDAETGQQLAPSPSLPLKEESSNPPYIHVHIQIINVNWIWIRVDIPSLVDNTRMKRTVAKEMFKTPCIREM